MPKCLLCNEESDEKICIRCYVENFLNEQHFTNFIHEEVLGEAVGTREHLPRVEVVTDDAVTLKYRRLEDLKIHVRKFTELGYRLISWDLDIDERYGSKLSLELHMFNTTGARPSFIVLVLDLESEKKFLKYVLDKFMEVELKKEKVDVVVKHCEYEHDTFKVVLEIGDVIDVRLCLDKWVSREVDPTRAVETLLKQVSKGKLKVEEVLEKIKQFRTRIQVEVVEVRSKRGEPFTYKFLYNYSKQREELEKELMSELVDVIEYEILQQY